MRCRMIRKFRCDGGAGQGLKTSEGGTMDL